MALVVKMAVFYCQLGFKFTHHDFMNNYTRDRRRLTNAGGFLKLKRFLNPMNNRMLHLQRTDDALLSQHLLLKKSFVIIILIIVTKLSFFPINILHVQEQKYFHCSVLLMCLESKINRACFKLFSFKKISGLNCFPFKKTFKKFSFEKIPGYIHISYFNTKSDMLSINFVKYGAIAYKTQEK